jgi:hypothetical protein
MNMTLEAKDIVLFLVGVVGSVVANYIYKNLEGTNTAAQAIERDINSKDINVRARAARLCLFIAAKLYIFANMFWVVSGAAWIFGDSQYLVTLIVLAASSVIAIFLFWLSLRWLQRAQRASSV